jgi:hypothetical protein
MHLSSLCRLKTSHFIQHHFQATLGDVDFTLKLAPLLLPAILLLSPHIVNTLRIIFLAPDLLLSRVQSLLDIGDQFHGFLPLTSKLSECGRGTTFQQCKLSLQRSVLLGD